jgi:hypothetical protein
LLLGVLTVSLKNASLNFGTIASGGTASAAVGDITATNTLYSSNQWSVTVAATDFTNGGPQTTCNANCVSFTTVSFAPGTTIVATNGNGAQVTPGTQGSLTGSDAQPGQTFSSPLAVLSAPAGVGNAPSPQGSFDLQGSTATVNLGTQLGKSASSAGLSYFGTFQYTITG